MPQLSVAAAAKLVGKDRKTLYRLVKEGRLSATLSDAGQRQIETSELLRVFGAFEQKHGTGDSREAVVMPQRETSPGADSETVKIALLEAELRHARDLLRLMLEAKDSQIEDLRLSVRLLEASRPQLAPLAEQKKGFWPWSRRK